MAEELKACPFCGGTEIIDADYGQEYWCHCNTCGCHTGKFGSRAVADNHWNTRAQLPCPADPDAVAVPRELLARIADPFTSTAHLLEALRELRALLAGEEGAKP